MMMRVQPTQVKKDYTFPRGSSVLDVSRARLAGLTTYEAILVGACGGKSGQAYSANSDIFMGRAGGGGGGTLHLLGDLEDLPLQVPISVGEVGDWGANGSGPNAFAPDGHDGGDTSFNTVHKANGGSGGKGGNFTGTSANGATEESGVGGAGGTNSAGLGAGGAGGSTGGYNYSPVGGFPFDSTSPTTGTYVAGGVSPVVGGGRGGGGGRPKISAGQATGLAATGGSVGNSPSLSATAQGVDGNHGGYGGGANIASIFDTVDEYYGAGGISGRHAYGVVVVKIS